MPIYEYRCDDCDSLFEVIQKMSDDPLEVCEKCGGHLRKVLHPVAIHFKGSGFYTTDYGRGSSRRQTKESAESSSAGESAASTGAGKDGASKPDGKPAEKPGGTAAAGAAKAGSAKAT